MKTSSKLRITGWVFWGISIVWSISGIVATGGGKTSIAYIIVDYILLVVWLLFIVAGAGAGAAEKKK